MSYVPIPPSYFPNRDVNPLTTDLDAQIQAVHLARSRLKQ